MANNDFSLDDLTTPLTVDEVKASIYNVLAAVGTDTTVWKPGAVVRTVIAAAAIIIAALSQLIALIARGGYLDLAEGAWLRLKARYDYGIEWQGPTFAGGKVTLNNTGGGIYSFGPDEIVLINTATGKEYRNVEAVEIGALQTGIEIEIRAVEAGSASNALPGEIDFGSPVLGVEIDSPSPIIGTDGEDDPELRARARAKPKALSPNGPRDAYAYVAGSAVRADGTPIGATRVAARPDGQGGVDIYVATTTGGVDGDAEDPNTDLGIVAEEIWHKATPLCVDARVYSAVEKPIDIAAAVWLLESSSLTEAQVALAVQAEIAELLRHVPIGGHDHTGGVGLVYRSAIEAAITRARVAGSPINAFRTQLTAPAVNVNLGANEVPTVGELNVAVSFVAVT